MTTAATSDTRERMIAAAVDLIAASPGEEFSLRAVCDAVSVKLPTLYHFFGSKQGLVDAIVEYGFNLYLGQKSSAESSGDPIQDIRAGWDAHVGFGLAHPGLYALMYGSVRPGHAPAAQARPDAMLRRLTAEAEAQGRLVVSSDEAATHILATNVGVTLRQIVSASPDPGLTESAREGVIAAITGTGAPSEAPLAQAIEYAAAHPDVLGSSETQLLIEWLRALAARARGAERGEARRP